MDDFKEDILKFLRKETKLDNIPLEIPPNPEMGDYSINLAFNNDVIISVC